MKTQAEIDASNQYSAYHAGWRAGTASKAIDPRFDGHDNEKIKTAYNQGYGDGRIALNVAMQKAADRYGHRVSVLRLCATLEEVAETDVNLRA